MLRIERNEQKKSKCKLRSPDTVHRHEKSYLVSSESVVLYPKGK